MITLSINLDKVDKNKVVKGEKGKYLNLVLIETPNGQYGDYMVKQDSTKEERANKVQLPILGNAKNLVFGGSAPKSAPAQSAQSGGLDDDDIPF